MFAVVSPIVIGGVAASAQIDTGAVTSSLNAKDVLVSTGGDNTFPLRVSFTMILRHTGGEEYHEFTYVPGRYYKKQELLVKLPAVLQDINSVPYEFCLYTKLRSRENIRYDITIGLDVFSHIQAKYKITPLLRVTDADGRILPEDYKM